QVVIDEEAATLVDYQLFHQRRTYAHGHRTDYLAARRLRIENAAGCAYREHPAHTDFGGRGIDADLHEVRAEGRLLILFVELTIFDAVLSREAALAGSVRKRHAAIGEPDLAVDELGFGRVEAELLRHGLAQLDAGRVDA